MKKTEKIAVLAACACLISINNPGTLLSKKSLSRFSEAVIKRKSVPFEEESPFKAHCHAYGFKIDNCWSPYKMKDFNVTSKNEIDQTNTTNYTIQIVEVLLKNKYYTDTYAYAYRAVISPKQVRDWGFMGIGSHGDDWHITGETTSVKLRKGNNLADWSPEIRRIKQKVPSVSGLIQMVSAFRQMSVLITVSLLSAVPLPWLITDMRLLIT